MNPLIVSLIGAGIRWLLASIGALLAKHGHDIPAGFWEEAAGIIMTAASGIWGAYNKFVLHGKIDQAVAVAKRVAPGPEVLGLVAFLLVLPFFTGCSSLNTSLAKLPGVDATNLQSDTTVMGYPVASLHVGSTKTDPTAGTLTAGNVTFASRIPPFYSTQETIDSLTLTATPQQIETALRMQRAPGASPASSTPKFIVNLP